jgi:hypothetical protein
MKVLIKAQGVATPYQYEGDFATLGDVKAVTTGIVWDNTNVIVHATQSLLLNDEASLPQGDTLVLVVLTKKSAAGAAGPANYHTMGRNDLLRFVSSVVAGEPTAKEWFSGFSNWKTADIVTSLDEFYADEVAVPVANGDEFDSVIAQLDSAKQAVQGLKNRVVGTPTPATFGGFTQEELQSSESYYAAFVR